VVQGLQIGGTRLVQQSCSEGHDQPQHPLRDPPTISEMLAEPPSEVGTGGGQTVEEEAAWLAAAAVEVAACVEVSALSPDNSNGTCDVLDDEALMLDVLPPAAALPVDPVPDADPPVPPAVTDPDGKVCVGTLRGSEALLAPVDVVWARAVVVPKTEIAIRKRIRIALSPWFSRSRIARQRANSRKRQ
jgi:hypothetical protein